MSDQIDLLALHLVGGRLSNQPTRASPQSYYGDPSNSIKFNRDAMEKTKAIEQILHYDIENWIRWGRQRDWMPISFRCPLGYLYKSTDVHQGSVSRPPKCDEIGAGRFERIVVALPEKHRQAFVMHQLGRAVVNGHIRILKGYDQNARLLGVAKSKYYELLQEAHSIVLRQVMLAKNILRAVENPPNLGV